MSTSPSRAAEPGGRSIVGRLIAKDLYLYRGLVVSAVVAGGASLALSRFGPGGNAGKGLDIGFLLFVTTVITFGIFVSMWGVLKERQERSQLFVLSLPVSPAQYSIAKVASALIAFLVPWSVLTGGVVAATVASGDPRGGIPFFLAMMTFFLANFSLLLAVVVITMSELWAIAGILVTNVSVTVFLIKLGSLPAVAGHTHDAVATFSPTILIVLALEIALILLSLGLAFTLPSRKKDFV